MIKSVFITIFVMVLFNISMQGQSTDDKNTFSQPLKSYFELDRENIHLHLNKDVYITNEKIWFKGYIIEKKNAKPYAPTANVYISLIDPSGKIILTNLYYSENSIFDGYIILDDNIKSGKYALQVYTNYMNNFSEDESSVFPISIINSNDTSYSNYKAVNYNAVSISTHAESGVFLEGINNTIGIKVADCNGNGIAVANGQVLDASGIVVSSFTTNQQGYGKFDIIKTTKSTYTISFEIEGKKFQQNLPVPQLTGISFSANNYAFTDKIVLTVKTNERTLQNEAGNQYTFVIHQNDVVSYADFSLKSDELETLLSIPSQYLSDGLNTIRLINDNREQVAERIVFKPFPIKATSEITLHRQRMDSLVFRGSSPLPLASLSVSVLPAKTGAAATKSIYGTLYFDNYLTSSIQNPQYYLKDFNRKKHFELDNVLITATSTYEWQSMLHNPPQKKFDFDSGLTIKGTVNSPVGDREKVSILMSSPLLGINETAKLNSKNEFQFDNVLAIDSTMLFFSLLDEKQRFTKLNMYTRLLTPSRQFVKASIGKSTACKSGDEIRIDANWPEIRDAINLSAVNVEGKNKEEELSTKYQSRFNNNMARGYKITDTEAGTYRDVLSWLASHGYNTTTEGGRVVLTRNYSTSFQGSNSPSVFIDDAPIGDIDFLLNMSMQTIDEIYINRRGYGAGSTGANGIIRIYTKKGFGSQQSSIKINSQSLLVKNGYQPLKSFKNPEYLSVHNDNFQQFGTIGWISNVDTDENGMFGFSIPNLYQEAILILVEGISADGQVVSEHIKINITER